MSKVEIGLSFLKREDEGEKIVGVRIKPENFSDHALLRLAAFQFTGIRPRQCVLVMATARTIISPEYMRNVNLLDPDTRIKHVVDTAVAMRKAMEVHIQFNAVDK